MCDNCRLSSAKLIIFGEILIAVRRKFVYIRYFLLLVLLFSVYANAFAQKKERFRLKTVVIDPGHGGKDPGACYGKIYEKDIVLDVALKLGNKIKKSYPSIKVVYTRSTDKYLTLKERGILANKADGDIFISIHVNSTDDKVTRATGSETFTLGLHKSAASLEVAKRENSVITFEEGYEKSYEGFNPKDPESYIMFGLGQYSFSMSSIALANSIEKNFLSLKNLPSRGVKQAGFLVLWYAAMPAVYIELGFINNPKDRVVLATSSGREKLANAIFKSFKTYKESVEVESQYTSDGEPKQTAAVKKDVNARFTTYSRTSIGYGVQLLTSSKKVAITTSNFGEYAKNVFEVRSGNRYKYIVGVTTSYDYALSIQRKIRGGKRYNDCFMVGLKHGIVTTPTAVRGVISDK